MRSHRLFLPQEQLDIWLGEGRVRVEGEVLVMLPEQSRLQLTSAVLFKSEVTSGEDPNDLVGRVKDLEQLAALTAEHYADSVILGDNAYQVVEGFAATPEGDSAADQSDQSIDLLARFVNSG